MVVIACLCQVFSYHCFTSCRFQTSEKRWVIMLAAVCFPWLSSHEALIMCLLLHNRLFVNHQTWILTVQATDDSDSEPSQPPSRFSGLGINDPAGLWSALPNYSFFFSFPFENIVRLCFTALLKHRPSCMRHCCHSWETLMLYHACCNQKLSEWMYCRKAKLISHVGA